MNNRPWPSWRRQGCGTEAAYQRHRRNGEKPCQACTEASARAWLARKAARQQRALREAS